MRLMDVMMIFMWSPVCMGWKCEMRAWASVIVCRRNFERWLWMFVCGVCCCHFFRVWCALRDKRVWICTDKIQSTKGRSDSSKRWIVVGAVVVIVVGVVEIINAANVNEFFSLCNAVGLSHTQSLFMQLLTTSMATKQLHFNPLRNHFSRLTNDTSPVRLHSVARTLLFHMIGRLR